MANIVDDEQVGSAVMVGDDIRRTLWRIAHQIVERHKNSLDMLFVGIPTRGFPLAQRLAQIIGDMEGGEVPVVPLDIRPYRDDVSDDGRIRNQSIHLSKEVEDKKVIIVDDVLFTGRTARAALDALTDAGRPRQVQLAVLVDRGHRELPIRADYVGKNMPTALSERIQVRLMEIDGFDDVVLLHNQGA